MTNAHTSIFSRRARALGQWVTLFAALALAGCASSDGAIERWDLSKSAEAGSGGNTIRGADAIPVKSDQKTAVVFVRQVVAPTRAAEPANIYINGRYQTSLVGNVFTEVPLCAGQHSFVAAYSDYQRDYNTKSVVLPFTVKAGPAQYFLVTEDAQGLARLEPMPAEQGKAAADGVKRLQTHAVSRAVDRGCARQ
ncbi:hypothetical protein [Ottowia testudinis]|uniref:DUF2846 domain-containing protein n=1 Tax=Ottowia testudinis TaxID=2816950 RepID=A0A975CGU7_9BURK|nr:hypothetical protein [Ottowia testudinis]QTD44846.1 hypothetical protein J1M35_17605 [Ottowia testudinis]